jgi:hypothetical protein
MSKQMMAKFGLFWRLDGRRRRPIVIGVGGASLHSAATVRTSRHRNRNSSRDGGLGWRGGRSLLAEGRAH